MKFGGIGVPELIIILIVVLLIFGPKNLPKLGSAIGKSIRGLREGMDAGKKEKDDAKAAKDADDDDAEVVAEVEDEEAEAPKKKVVKKKTEDAAEAKETEAAEA